MLTYDDWKLQAPPTKTDDEMTELDPHWNQSWCEWCGDWYPENEVKDCKCKTCINYELSND